MTLDLRQQLLVARGVTLDVGCPIGLQVPVFRQSVRLQHLKAWEGLPAFKGMEKVSRYPRNSYLDSMLPEMDSIVVVSRRSNHPRVRTHLLLAVLPFPSPFPTWQVQNLKAKSAVYFLRLLRKRF